MIPPIALSFARVATLWFVAQVASAQPADSYVVPLTEHGHPDFQGHWASASLTLLERPEYFDGLTTTAEAATIFIDQLKMDMGDLEDPDTYLQDISVLDVINGDLRTSAITDPADGQIPFSEHGKAVADWDLQRFFTQFDGPEIRPLDERCLGSLGHPPYRPFISDIPRTIVQTEDYVAIYTEDASGVRIISLKGHRQGEQRSYAGTSVGYWEGDVLVVRTSNFRGDDPGRLAIASSMLVGENSEVIERFTRLSAEELLYQFTITDADLYTQPWSAEFMMYFTQQPTYEYACHEGNYSMSGILLGGRMEQARQEQEDTGN